MDVGRLSDGLWWWSTDGWRSVYAEVGGAIILIDPVLPSHPEELARFWRALDRDVARLDAPLAVLGSEGFTQDVPAITGRYAGAHTAPPDGCPAGVAALRTGDGSTAYHLPALSAVVGATGLQEAAARIGTVTHLVRTGRLDGTESRSS